MSDDDDTPAAAAAAAPEVGKGWSEQDRRTLIITTVGTLAANIVTVILVGGAIALAHRFKAGQTESAALLGGLFGVGIGLFLIVIGIVMSLVFRRWGRLVGDRGLPGPNSLRWGGWSMIVLGCVSALWSAMILLGMAAGVK
jgi:hypothetical protein